MPDAGLAPTRRTARFGTWARNYIVLLSYLIAVGVTVGLLIIAEIAFRDQSNSQEWVLHTVQVIANVETLQQSITEAESASRAYLVSGDERFLKEYRGLFVPVEQGLLALKTLTRDNPTQQTRLAGLDGDIRRGFSQIDGLVDSRISGRMSSVADRLPAVADEIRKLKTVTVALKEEEERLLRERVAARDASVERVATALVAFGSVSVLTLSLLFWYVHRLWRLQERSQTRALEWAHHDALTGLPNRRLLYARIGMTRAHADREKLMFAVLCLDLDGFKTINDTLGHAAGDQMLKQVGQRLTSMVRREDTVARLGGDEFVVTLFNVTGRAACEHVARKIIDAIAEPFKLDGRDARVGTSIGIAVYPEHGATEDDLLGSADRALYHAKASGKGRHSFG